MMIFIDHGRRAMVALGNVIGRPQISRLLRGILWEGAVTELILSARPDIAVHHLQDPDQDRLMLKMMSYSSQI